MKTISRYKTFDAGYIEIKEDFVSITLKIMENVFNVSRMAIH